MRALKSHRGISIEPHQPSPPLNGIEKAVFLIRVEKVMLEGDPQALEPRVRIHPSQTRAQNLVSQLGIVKKQQQGLYSDAFYSDWRPPGPDS